MASTASTTSVKTAWAGRSRLEIRASEGMPANSKSAAYTTPLAWHSPAADLKPMQVMSIVLQVAVNAVLLWLILRYRRSPLARACMYHDAALLEYISMVPCWLNLPLIRDYLRERRIVSGHKSEQSPDGTLPGDSLR